MCYNMARVNYGLFREYLVTAAYIRIIQNIYATRTLSQHKLYERDILPVPSRLRQLSFVSLFHRNINKLTSPNS